jgi:hypothetical protein
MACLAPMAIPMQTALKKTMEDLRNVGRALTEESVITSLRVIFGRRIARHRALN